MTDENNLEQVRAEPLSTHGLNQAEIKELKLAGVKDADIEAIGKKAKTLGCTTTKAKVNLPSIIAAAKEELLGRFPEKSLFSANLVGTELVRMGLYRQVKGFNAVGDALGLKGLRLPSLPTSPRVYHLASIGEDDQQKQQQQLTLEQLRSDVVKILTADSEA